MAPAIHFAPRPLDREVIMHTQLSPPHRPVIVTIVAAVLSVVIALGLLAAVAGSFRHDGVPFERLLAAERACVDHGFASEREACMRLYLAAARVRHIASS